MIQPIDIVGLKIDLDEDIKRYVRKKIGRLSRYLPRHARKSVHAEVKLREGNKKHGNNYECEVVLHLPGETITSKDSTLNMFAAVDIVEAKLKNQLKKYKEMRTSRGTGIKGLIIGRFSSRRQVLPEEE